MTELIEFETDRLYVRQWQDTDRDPFARLSADPRVMEFFPSILDRAASDATIDRIQALIAERGWGFWAVETKAERQFIGFVGLHIPQMELPFSPCVEVGWRLAFDYWGRGYATEAGRGALAVGFDSPKGTLRERLCLSEIVSFTAILNRRSQAVMARLGMKESETFEHPNLPIGHPLRPHVLYRLSRSHWLSTCR